MSKKLFYYWLVFFLTSCSTTQFQKNNIEEEMLLGSWVSAKDQNIVYEFGMNHEFVMKKLLADSTVYVPEHKTTYRVRSKQDSSLILVMYFFDKKVLMDSVLSDLTFITKDTISITPISSDKPISPSGSLFIKK